MECIRGGKVSAGVGSIQFWIMSQRPTIQDCICCNIECIGFQVRPDIIDFDTWCRHVRVKLPNLSISNMAFILTISFSFFILLILSTQLYQGCTNEEDHRFISYPSCLPPTYQVFRRRICQVECTGGRYHRGTYNLEETLFQDYRPPWTDCWWSSSVTIKFIHAHCTIWEVIRVWTSRGIWFIIHFSRQCCHWSFLNK